MLVSLNLPKSQQNFCPLKEGFCLWFFHPRMRPKTFLQCFVLEQRESKAKLCRNVLGSVLGQKKDTKYVLKRLGQISLLTPKFPFEIDWSLVTIL